MYELSKKYCCADISQVKSSQVEVCKHYQSFWLQRLQSCWEEMYIYFTVVIFDKLILLYGTNGTDGTDGRS